MPIVSIQVNFEGDSDCEQRARSFSVAGDINDFGDMLGEILLGVSDYVPAGSGNQIASAVRTMDQIDPYFGTDYEDLARAATRTVVALQEQQRKHREALDRERRNG